MLRLIIVVFLIGISVQGSFAQEGRFQNISRHGFKDGQFGMIYPGLTRTNQYFTVKYKDQFVPFIKTVGVSDKAIYKLFGRWLVDGLVTFNWMLDETARSGDSLKYTLNGFNTSVNYGKDLLPDILEVDANFYLGAGYQHIRIVKQYSGVRSVYKHPSITANGIFECRVNMKKHGMKNGFSIGVRGGVLMDVWQSGWRTKDLEAEDFAKLSPVNLMAQFMLSWLL